ncbi:hypothetical protein [Streptomyces sp. KR55]|uniref:hypothetical protein n=1 Tax=Streptomyces sp. KR55 TaxID=3457425 RepID=UPI003FD5FEC4
MFPEDGGREALDAMKCPTREGLRDAVRNLNDVKVGLLLPGVTLSTGPATPSRSRRCS